MKLIGLKDQWFAPQFRNYVARGQGCQIMCMIYICLAAEQTDNTDYKYSEGHQ